MSTNATLAHKRAQTKQPDAQESTPQKVAAYLRADRHLDPHAAEALVKMIELAYEAMERGEIGTRKEG